MSFYVYIMFLVVVHVVLFRERIFDAILSVYVWFWLGIMNSSSQKNTHTTPNKYRLVVEGRKKQSEQKKRSIKKVLSGSDEFKHFWGENVCYLFSLCLFFFIVLELLCLFRGCCFVIFSFFLKKNEMFTDFLLCRVLPWIELGRVKEKFLLLLLRYFLFHVFFLLNPGQKTFSGYLWWEIINESIIFSCLL